MAYCPKTQLTCWRFFFYKVFGIMAYTCRKREEGFDVLDLRQPYSVIDYGD